MGGGPRTGSWACCLRVSRYYERPRTAASQIAPTWWVNAKPTRLSSDDFMPPSADQDKGGSIETVAVRRMDSLTGGRS